MNKKGMVLALMGFLLMFLMAVVFFSQAVQAEDQDISVLAGVASANYWSIILGGGNSSGENEVHAVVQTADGGYLAAGTASSSSSGDNDVLIVKFNQDGSIGWQKTFGESGSDGAYSLVAMSDGSYVIGGYKALQFWVFKIDNDGNVLWQKTYPNDGTSNIVNSIQETSGGGLIFVGQHNAPFVIKLESTGEIEWQKSYAESALSDAQIQETSDGGFILLGNTPAFGTSRKGIAIKLNNDGTIAWQKIYGDDTADFWINSGVETSDGGFILAGHIYDWNTSHETLWLLKLTSDGSITWQKVLDNDPYNGRALDVKETADGGFIVVGRTSSATASELGWLVKFNSDGTVAWQKAFEGGDQSTTFRTVSLTDDGGFLIEGDMDSAYSWTSLPWILKTDEYGNIYNCGQIVETNAVLLSASAPLQDTSISPINASLVPEDTFITPVDTSANIDVMCSVAVKAVLESHWINGYMTDGRDNGATSIKATNDGGAILALASYPEFTDDSDTSIMKLDSFGEISWKRTFDGSDENSEDDPVAVLQLDDGSYLLLIFTESFGGGTWLIKLDASGNILWEKVYDAYARTIREIGNGSYVLAGETYTVGAGDAWVAKLNMDGEIVWQKTYGGNQLDYATDIQELSNGEFVVSVSTQSFGAGETDAWILQLDANGIPVWQKTYGGTGDERVQAIEKTSGGGFIFAGYTDSYGSGLDDAWVVKLDSAGNISWQKVMGLGYTDLAVDIVQTIDGGYLIGGSSAVVDSSARSNGWVLKLDSEGERIWEKAYDGGGSERIYALNQRNDGTIFAAGDSWSPLTGKSTAWALKMDLIGDICDCNAIKVINTIITNSTATPQNTSIVPQDFNSIATDLSVPPVEFSIGINSVCLVFPDVHEIFLPLLVNP